MAGSRTQLAVLMVGIACAAGGHCQNLASRGLVAEPVFSTGPCAGWHLHLPSELVGHLWLCVDGAPGIHA